MYEDLKDVLNEKIEFWESDIRDEDVFDFTSYNLRPAIQESVEFSLYR